MKTRWNPDTREISVSSFLMRQFAFAHAVSDVASVFPEVESRYCSFQDIVAPVCRNLCPVSPTGCGSQRERLGSSSQGSRWLDGL